MSEYLTTTEVSEILGCHRATLQRWRKEGRGPEHIRPVNGHYLYPREAFNAWVVENNVTTLKADPEALRDINDSAGTRF